MTGEGYIKFRCALKEAPEPDIEEIDELIRARDLLFEKGLIGEYKNGIGFGNISVRISDSNQFWITGTRTGRFEKIMPEHFTKVVDFNLDENSLFCEGPVKASSESLTHAAFYSREKSAVSVAHVHNISLWRRLLNIIPTSSPKAEYGTPKMAREIYRLFDESDLREKRLMVAAGHEEGIFAFGESPKAAAELILREYESLPED